MRDDPKPSSLSPPIEPGTILAGKFRVDRVIASGGMGIILVAQHLLLRQRVAIKMLRAYALEDPEIVARFAREARAAARIRSEHVVRVIDVGNLDGTPYMVMEYLSGSDLSQVLKTNGPLPVEDAVEYLLQACVALAEAHHAGIVHRDLKPANLFLTRRTDGTPLVKVLDFGISKLREQSFNIADDADSITRTSAVMGSLNYMSPEQLRSARDVDLRTDVWALGVTLFKLLTHKNAFVADTSPELCVQILHGEPRSLASVRPDLPAGLGEVIRRCLQKKADDRYANVGEFATAIQEFAPARSRESIDRVVGIVRSEARFDSASPPPPDKNDGDSAPLDLSQPPARTEPSSIEIPVDVATFSTLGASVSSAPAAAVSKTTDAAKPATRSLSKVAWIAGAAITLGGGALLLSAGSKPGDAKQTLSDPSTTAALTASSVESSAQPSASNTATVDPTTAIASSSPSATIPIPTSSTRTHERHVTAGKAASPATTSNTAATNAATTPAPGEKPDFGGRK